MSKKRLNHTVVVIVVAVLVLSACKKPDDNETTGKDTVSRIIEIQNIPNSSDVVTIKAILGNVELASCPFKNGGFKLTLPPIIDDKYLYEWREYLTTASDPKAKIVRNIGIYGYSSAGISPIGYVNLRSVNYCCCSGDYVYADRDFTVIGKDSVYDDYNSVYTVDYNCYFKKGWNILYHCNGKHTTEKPFDVEFKWKYYEDTYPSVRFKKEKAYPNCVEMAILIGGHYYPQYYFDDTDGFSPYYSSIFYTNGQAADVVYFDKNGNLHTAISDYYFERSQAYTVVCSDDGNNNLVFSVVKDGQKSLSSGRKYNPTMYTNQKNASKIMR